METEIEISRRYVIMNKRVTCLRYLLVRSGNFYGIKIIFQKGKGKNQSEENKMILPKNSKDKIISFINILAENLSFPIELEGILEDLNCE